MVHERGNQGIHHSHPPRPTAPLRCRAGPPGREAEQYPPPKRNALPRGHQPAGGGFPQHHPSRHPREEILVAMVNASPINSHNNKSMNTHKKELLQQLISDIEQQKQIESKIRFDAKRKNFVITELDGAVDRSGISVTREEFNKLLSDLDARLFPKIIE
jgi:hypothetical protein